MERNHLCIFGRGSYGQYSCEIMFGLVVQEEISFKDCFLFLTIMAILLGGTMRAILVEGIINW